MPTAFNGVTILALANASSDRLDNTSKRRHFQDDLCHLDMESPAVVGGPLSRPWIEPGALRHQEENGNERGMFPTRQLTLTQREGSDSAGTQTITSGRERCPRDRRVARHWISD